MNLPNQSADDQRKEVRRQVRNNIFSFIGIVALIRAGKKFLIKMWNIVNNFYFFHSPKIISTNCVGGFWRFFMRMA